MRILLNTVRKRWVREHTPLRWDALSTSYVTTEPVQEPELSPEAVVLAIKTRTVLDQTIRALSERQRTVLTLRDVDGWPSDEVCTRRLYRPPARAVTPSPGSDALSPAYPPGRPRPEPISGMRIDRTRYAPEVGCTTQSGPGNTSRSLPSSNRTRKGG